MVANNARIKVSEKGKTVAKKIGSSVVGEEKAAPGKVLKANTTSKPGKIVKLKLSRSKLVGKHPEVHHLPAPKTKLKLDDETRKSLLASMVLI